MESPPPESSPHLPGERRGRQARTMEPPSTPQKASKESSRQLPTPMSPTTGKAQLMVVFDTSNIKDRLDFSEYQKVTPLPSPIMPSQPIIPYNTRTRDTDMNNAKAWLASSTTAEQMRQRMDALVEAMLHNSHKFTSTSRGLRANGERDPWSDSEDEDDRDDDGHNHKDKSEVESQPHNDPIITHNPGEEPVEASAMTLLGHAPRLNDRGIENEEDLKVIQNFRNTHNVAVASARCGQLVFPQLGPRPSPAQQATPALKPASVKGTQSSSGLDPPKNKTAANHRITKISGNAHGPTGQLVATSPVPKRKYTRRNNSRKKNRADKDTDFNPASEEVSHRDERTAPLASSRRNPTRTTSVAGKKAVKGKKKGRRVGSKNKAKTVNTSQKGMLDGIDLDD